MSAPVSTAPAQQRARPRRRAQRAPQDLTAGFGRQARLARCPGCHAPILRGLDDDVCAALARTDVRPVGALVAAVAYLAGLGVYRLDRGIGERPGELSRLDGYALSSPITRPVLVEHCCPHRQPPSTRRRSWTGPPDLAPARRERREDPAAPGSPADGEPRSCWPR